MSRQTALKIRVEVGPDHTIRLPDEVPVGPADVIVMVPDTASTKLDPAGLIGLMADEPEVMDEIIRGIHEHRERWGRRRIG